MKVNMDLNADLGEGEDEKVTTALMKVVDSANIACGGHAGDPDSMEAAVRIAKQCGVHVGAHPGYADRENFGRIKVRISTGEFRLLLLHQIGALRLVLDRHDVPLAHIKLHGALYHAVEADANLAKVYLQWVHDYFPKVRVFAFAGGRVCAMAEKFGVDVWGEAFVERGYGVDGQLIPRGAPGSFLVSADEIRRRVRQLVRESKLADVAGSSRTVRARTLCVHADTPNAEQIARVARAALANL